MVVPERLRQREHFVKELKPLSQCRELRLTDDNLRREKVRTTDIGTIVSFATEA
jgi:hypothetical protein